MNEYLSKLNERILGGPTKEGEQAVLRFPIGILIFVYLIYINEPGSYQREYLIYFATFFFLYSTAVTYWLYKDNGIVPLRYHTIVVIDVFNATFALFLGNLDGMPIVFLFVWFNLGYAYRFGIKYMWLSSLYSFIGVTILYIGYGQYIIDHISVYIGIILMIIIPPFYLQLFIKREARVKSELIKLTHENRELLDQNISAMENASKTIAADLHDMLGQEFVAIRNYAQLAKKKLEIKNEDNIIASINYLREIINIVSGLQSVIKDILKKIWPESLQELGLVASIRELIFLAQKSNPSIKFQFKTTSERRNYLGDKDIHIYRIIQEAITNILKHAKASVVDVSIKESITRNDQTLNILIKDNGIGINASNKHKNKGLGLVSMRERTNSLGGKLQIDSTRNGTEINIVVPI